MEGEAGATMKWLYKVMSHLSAAVRVCSLQASYLSVAGTVLILTDVREIACIHPRQDLSDQPI